MLDKDKQFFEELYQRALTEQEVFEAKYSLLGFFDVLSKIDQRLKREDGKND